MKVGRSNLPWTTIKLARTIRKWLSGLFRTSTPESNRPNWRGVYQQFADVPTLGSGFDDHAWASDTRRLTERALRECSIPNRLPLVEDDNTLLPVLVANILCTGSSRIKVLDFGGGMGISFVHLIASVSQPDRIEYHVIETPQVCREGAELFSNDTRIHFHSRLPDAIDGVDVVYMNSALQYIEDYRGLLRALCDLSPRFILLARCSAGNIATYATAQLTLPGKQLPYWFIDVRELVSILGECHYTPAFMARGSYSVNQMNFAEEHQIGSTCNLLFCRARNGRHPLIAPR